MVVVIVVVIIIIMVCCSKIGDFGATMKFSGINVQTQRPIK